MEHGKKHTFTNHKSHLQKQTVQLSLHVMTPNRFHHLKVVLFVIRTRGQSRHASSFVENPTFKGLIHPDWIPYKTETIRNTVGENFLVGSANVNKTSNLQLSWYSFLIFTSILFSGPGRSLVQSFQVSVCSGNSMSAKTVESTLPVNGFGVPDIYVTVEEGDTEGGGSRLSVPRQ